jgi:hypothetical protein
LAVTTTLVQFGVAVAVQFHAKTVCTGPTAINIITSIMATPNKLIIRFAFTISLSFFFECSLLKMSWVLVEYKTFIALHPLFFDLKNRFLKE